MSDAIGTVTLSLEHYEDMRRARLEVENLLASAEEEVKTLRAAILAPFLAEHPEPENARTALGFWTEEKLAAHAAWCNRRDLYIASFCHARTAK